MRELAHGQRLQLLWWEQGLQQGSGWAVGIRNLCPQQYCWGLEKSHMPEASGRGVLSDFCHTKGTPEVYQVWSWRDAGVTKSPKHHP